MLNLLCGGSYLGFLIDTYKLAFCKGPPNDNSGTGWKQSNLLFLRFFFFFTFSIQSYVKINFALRWQTYIFDWHKNTHIVKDHPGVFQQKLLSNGLVVSDTDNLKTFPHRTPMLNLSCGGDHLGFIIDTKINTTTLRLR